MEYGHATPQLPQRAWTLPEWHGGRGSFTLNPHDRLVECYGEFFLTAVEETGRIYKYTIHNCIRLRWFINSCSHRNVRAAPLTARWRNGSEGNGGRWFGCKYPVLSTPDRNARLQSTACPADPRYNYIRYISFCEQNESVWLKNSDDISSYRNVNFVCLKIFVYCLNVLTAI